MAKLYASLYERLVANTELAIPDNPQSCWLWTGYCTRAGYGQLAMRVPGGGRATKPRQLAVHRAMLEELLDALFPFDEAGHLCGNPLCINPDHLEVQTQIFNLGERRGYRAPEGRMIPVLFPRESVWTAVEEFLETLPWPSSSQSPITAPSCSG